MKRQFKTFVVTAASIAVSVAGTIPAQACGGRSSSRARVSVSRSHYPVVRQPVYNAYPQPVCVQPQVAPLQPTFAQPLQPISPALRPARSQGRSPIRRSPIANSNPRANSNPQASSRRRTGKLNPPRNSNGLRKLKRRDKFSRLPRFKRLRRPRPPRIPPPATPNRRLCRCWYRSPRAKPRRHQPHLRFLNSPLPHRNPLKAMSGRGK